LLTDAMSAVLRFFLRSKSASCAGHIRYAGLTSHQAPSCCSTSSHSAAVAASLHTPLQHPRFLQKSSAPLILRVPLLVRCLGSTSQKHKRISKASPTSDAMLRTTSRATPRHLATTSKCEYCQSGCDLDQPDDVSRLCSGCDSAWHMECLPKRSVFLSTKVSSILPPLFPYPSRVYLPSHCACLQHSLTR
jgi:hypothetical protein